MSTHKCITVVDKVINTIASTTQTSVRVKGPDKTLNSSSHVGETEDDVGVGQHVLNLTSSQQNREPETSGASDSLVTDDPILDNSETLTTRSASQADVDQNPNANPIPIDVVASENSIAGSGDQAEVDQDMDVYPIADDVTAIENSTAGSVNQANLDENMEVKPIASDAGTFGTLTVGGVDALAIGMPNKMIHETPDGSNFTQPVLTVVPAITNTPVQKAAPIKYMSGMSAYERERAENIKQNKKILASVGLDNTGKDVFRKHNKENNAPSKLKKNPRKLMKTSVEKRKLRSSGKPISDRLACVMTNID
jgi:hypothetical protein